MWWQRRNNQSQIKRIQQISTKNYKIDMAGGEGSPLGIGKKFKFDHAIK